MAKAVAKRNVGAEILEGLRELKGGHAGRVMTVPAVASIRERTGSKVAERRLVLRGLYSWWLPKIHKHYLRWHKRVA